MRPDFRLRGLRAAQLTVGSVMLAAPASALALSSGHTSADGHPAHNLPAHVFPHHVALGHAVRVSGHAAADAAGATVELLTAPANHRRRWQRVATTRVGPHGGWAVRTHLRESSIVRAIEVAADASRAHAADTSATATAAAVSRATRVQVKARMQVAVRPRSAIAGRAAAVAGHLEPARAGRRVSVQAHGAGGWHTIGRGNTGHAGGFSVAVHPAGGSHPIRVVFSGDRLNARATDGAGTLTEYSPVEVSWYDDAGSTACGFHAGDGVASRTLPCGTKVHFRSGGRTVTATVDDRGPYVYSREFDLNQNTAAALGFDGVGVVDASIG